MGDGVIKDEEVFMTLEYAKLSNCGYSTDVVNTQIREEYAKRKKQARKDKVTFTEERKLIDLNSYDNAVKKWNAQLEEFMQQHPQVQGTPAAVQDVCAQLFDVKREADNRATTSDESTWCDDMCGDFSRHKGLQVVGYLGESWEKLRKQLDEVTRALQDALYERNECQLALTALTGFRDEMLQLSEDIDIKFDIQKAAKIALQRAREAWEEADEVYDDESELAFQAEELVNEKTSEVAELVQALKKLKSQSKGIEDKMKEAMARLEEFTQLVVDAMIALQSFDKLK